MTTLTELGLLAWLTCIAPRELLTGASVRTIAKAGGAAAVAGALVVISGVTALVAMIPLALLLYGAAIVALRTVGSADLRAIGALLVPRRSAPAERRAVDQGAVPTATLPPPSG